MGGQFYLIKLLFKLSYSYEPNCDLLCCLEMALKVCGGGVAQDMWWKLRRICGGSCAGYVVCKPILVISEDQADQ